ncbi:ferritin light chain 1-like [Myotis myotis]|uniref:ferritin light chain 1-like n=1 Tax=Myotis myotis TaxID=51298 RepID=UPI00174989E4|nr:ferritin light chain 1-like [Myotis myotis]
MSSQIRQNYPTYMEAAVNRVAPLHPLSLRAPTPTSHWASMSIEDVALQGGGHFFPELAEKLQGSERLLKLQTQRGGCTPPQDVLRPPQVSGQNSGRQGGRPGLGEEPDQALVDLQALVLPPGRSALIPAEPLPGEEGKRIKKMGHTWLPPQAAAPGRAGERL